MQAGDEAVVAAKTRMWVVKFRECGKLLCELLVSSKVDRVCL